MTQVHWHPPKANNGSVCVRRFSPLVPRARPRGFRRLACLAQCLAHFWARERIVAPITLLETDHEAFVLFRSNMDIHFSIMDIGLEGGAAKMAVVYRSWYEDVDKSWRPSARNMETPRMSLATRSSLLRFSVVHLHVYPTGNTSCQFQPEEFKCSSLVWILERREACLLQGRKFFLFFPRGFELVLLAGINSRSFNLLTPLSQCHTYKYCLYSAVYIRVNHSADFDERSSSAVEIPGREAIENFPSFAGFRTQSGPC